MNLIITDRCNRACPYCFAQEKVRLSDGKMGMRFISFADMEYCMEFLQRSRRRDLKLLGGEPTLHPEFNRIVEAALSRKLKVLVFTNGLWTDEVCEFVARTKNSSFNFLFNVNEPQDRSPWENDRLAETLAIAGPRGRIGFNLFRTDFDLRFVRDLIGRFGLQREVRMGIAHPIAGHDNEYVPDRDIPRMGERLLAQLEELTAHDILGTLDCGFPLCMFPEEQLGLLVTCVKPGTYSQCRPIIDVGPDLNAWPCFPLSNLLNVNLRDFHSDEELIEYYDRKLSGVRNIGSMDRCLDCRFRRRGQCCGGCIARTLRNWESNGDHSLVEKLK
jgi:MoaA/NifB/PqqE/SkfB family radical SAM enzyme